MNNKQKKLILVEYTNTNLGDKVIADSTEYLIHKLGNNIQIDRMGLFADKSLYKRLNLRNTYTYPYWKQIWKFIKYYFSSIRGRKIYKHYEEHLKGADAVIFPGGGLIKHSLEMCWCPIHTIVNYCSKRNIPVYFNAVGVEGYDESNFYSKLLKHLLNNKTVKKITTRDDIENLSKYVSDTTKIGRVGDSALWSKEVYNIQPKEKNENIIGIGLIREYIFKDYGMNITGDSIIDMYVNVIKEIENRNYKWQLFSNGGISDYELGLKILERIGADITVENIAKRPENAKELVNLINNYKALIAARLHANIIATALEIPTIGLIWNDKLKFYGELLDIGDRFLYPDQFKNAKFVADKLEDAINNGYNIKKIDDLKNSTITALNDFISNDVLKSENI